MEPECAKAHNLKRAHRSQKVFTGIIEELGFIQELRIAAEGAKITIAAKRILPGLKIGDSISVNGVCLTATQLHPVSFQCDISAETLRLSSFKLAKPGERVNLERSLMVGDRLGGHFVLGHVDGVGRMISKTASGPGFVMNFGYPKELDRYLVYKGSIAINGISLTIASLEQSTLSVAVIPHTCEATNLRELGAGDPVNLEVDVLGRYFERFFQLGLLHQEIKGPGLTSEYLKNQGF
jgi:riboflavin synthase